MLSNKKCNFCPRECAIVRTDKNGFCRAGPLPVVARAALHFGEEPCISGTCGSGAIFFCGCSLRCEFCQNYEISRNTSSGKEVSVEHLASIMRELQSQGAHNINLVTATHFADSVCAALDVAKLEIPVVYNCGGYESLNTLDALYGKVQIYMPDMKYSDDSLASNYSHAPDYVARAKEAIIEMYRQTGPYVLDDKGILKSGVLIRHLILPNHVRNSIGVIDWVSKTFPKGSVLFSLMSQYTPVNTDSLPSELSRSLKPIEYKLIQKHLTDVGIEDGYVQELSSAIGDYVPAFNLTGVCYDD